MNSTTLKLVALSADRTQSHIVPVTSVDDAKEKLDALNASSKQHFKGHIEVQHESGVSETWIDPEFNLSDLEEYFEELDENGGYETHAEFAEDNGMFHGKMDELFGQLEK